ncbi:low molecular weight protein arginine phosphatase [Pullulanibacillus sp. KACC 23026]|uniref:low molecular weight protein arginine phosphatase n=1 Tax=Pullulanibacillus sp. KACC 23026 TaxID=3028315 RepID=UPI0023AE715D|nr:low molecular weight protein arginine phosphatase [Pullulanibacillus sp. KACC 23026]WEG13103.1 low molecular weight protein arginine phosphatase [Pullulanibacillus sp. KACC 23026]
MKERILFVCTGNTCRSPMAETILNHHGKDRAEAKSAGLFANKGQGANPLAVKALEKLGIPMGEHHSQPLTGELVDWATLILTMTQNHKQSLIMDYPEAIDKTYTLKEYVYDQLEQNRFWKSWQEAVSEREEARLIVDQYAKETTGLDDAKKEAVERLLKAEERVKTLEEEIPNYDIKDPFGGDLEEYQTVSRELEYLIRQWMEKEEEQG